MRSLIESLVIFLKYSDENKVICEDGVMIVAIDPSLVSDDDKRRLFDMNFLPDKEKSRFVSFCYGGL